MVAGNKNKSGRLAYNLWIFHCSKDKVQERTDHTCLPSHVWVIKVISFSRFLKLHESRL